MFNFKKFSLLMIFVILGLSSGCGDPSRPKDLPKCYPVVLTIAQEGVVLPGAMVALVSEDPNFKWNTAGTTDDKGVVEFWTLGKFKGAPAGKYAVTVSKSISISPQTGLPVEKASDSAGSATGMTSISPGTMPIPFNLVDRSYTNHSSTPLKIEVLKKKTTAAFDVGAALTP